MKNNILNDETTFKKDKNLVIEANKKIIKSKPSVLAKGDERYNVKSLIFNDLTFKNRDINKSRAVIKEENIINLRNRPVISTVQSTVPILNTNTNYIPQQDINISDI